MNKSTPAIPYVKLFLMLLFLPMVMSQSCPLSSESYGRTTKVFESYAFSVGKTSYWFDLTEWTQPDTTTNFTVNVTSSKSLTLEEKVSESDDVRVWAMLSNGHGGPTSYLPMKLELVSFRKYQAKYSGMAPDLFGQDQGPHKSPAKWEVRVDKKYYGDPVEDFTIEVDCTISYIPWENN